MKKPQPSDAYQRFVKSIDNLSLDDWREGEGYDLDALEEIRPKERPLAIQLLSERLDNHGDWRDVEALAAIDLPEAREQLRKATKHANYQVNLRAAEELDGLGEDINMEELIIAALRGSEIYTGLTQALELAEEHPSERIKDTLLDIAVNGSDEGSRVNCAGLALYLGGKASEAFDWDYRPLFLKFGEEDRAIRLEGYREMCGLLGIAPALS